MGRLFIDMIWCDMITVTLILTLTLNPKWLWTSTTSKYDEPPLTYQHLGLVWNLNSVFHIWMSLSVTTMHHLYSVNTCLLDAADVLGWMVIHVWLIWLRLFHLTMIETAVSYIMTSSLVHIMSRFVCITYFICAQLYGLTAAYSLHYHQHWAKCMQWYLHHVP